MDTFSDISFSVPVDAQSPDPLILGGILLEEAAQDALGIELGKRGPSEEQDLAYEPPRKRVKPSTVVEQDDIGPGESPAPVLPSIDPGAGRWSYRDETQLELLKNKLEIVIGWYNPSYLDAGIFFGISPKKPEHSSLPGGMFTVFIVLKPPFPYERIPHRLRALEYIDAELNRVLWCSAWRPRQMIYYILDEEHPGQRDPDKKYTGYWAEARLGGPQGFDYGGAFTRTEKTFSMAPSRKRKAEPLQDDESSQVDAHPQEGNPLPPDWTQVRFDTDTKFILEGRTTGGKGAQRPPPPKKASALKLGAGRATSRKPKQDSLRKKVVTKQMQYS